MPDFEGKPIRMRGYYRALKRGEKWATKIHSLKSKGGFSYILSLRMRNIDLKKMFLSKLSWINKLDKDKSWNPVPLIVPFNITKKITDNKLE